MDNPDLSWYHISCEAQDINSGLLKHYFNLLVYRESSSIHIHDISIIGTEYNDRRKT